MFDIHNHYLADIDDGPTTEDESLALVRLAVEQGISHVLCTPHYHHGRYDWQAEKVSQVFARLQQLVQEHNLDLQLACAAEVRISDEVLIDFKQGKIPFCGQWEGKDAILLEMSHGQIPMGIEQMLKWFLQQGVQPIIAHPERNKAIMRDIRRAQSLVNAGALFQLTAGSIAGHFGENAQLAAQDLLKQGSVQFIASDAHNPKRPPAMRAGFDAVVEYMQQHLPGGKQEAEALATRLTVDNPRTLTQSLFGGDA